MMPTEARKTMAWGRYGHSRCKSGARALAALPDAGSAFVTPSSLPGGFTVKASAGARGASAEGRSESALK
jgi:hypothetical protein